MNETTLLYLILVMVVIMELQLLLMARKTDPGRRGRLRGACFVDTSVLMDGRIIAVAQTGFIPSRLVIPRSVLNELQLLADGSDSDKRSRARHGLDVAKQLQDMSTVNVIILADEGTSAGVDRHLLTLAKQYRGTVCTNDFNLNKVAQVEGIHILNINDLARQIKMSYLPGERITLEIIQKGNDSHQGVGYLADGTMVVVDKAYKDIGTSVEVEFIRSLQTAAGRMLFAKKVQAAKKSDNHSIRSKGRSKRSPSNEESLVELANR